MTRRLFIESDSILHGRLKKLLTKYLWDENGLKEEKEVLQMPAWLAISCINIIGIQKQNTVMRTSHRKTLMKSNQTNITDS